MEVVPLPRQEIVKKKPVHLEVAGLEAWPNNRFRILLDWNGSFGKWIVEMEHLGTGDVFEKAPVSLMQRYDYKRFVSFIFHDPSNRATEVTPENLGESVRLGVFPLEDAL